MRKMDSMLHEQDKPTEVVPQNKPKKVRQLDRVVIFNQANLNSKEDIDRYVQNIKNKLLSFLNDDDEIQIK